MAVLLVYVALLVILVGSLAVIKPLGFLRIRNRRMGAGILLFGLATGLVALLWPATLQRTSASRMQLDKFMPTYHFHEVHTKGIHASPDRIFRALKAVTPEEVRFLRLLFGLRQLPERLLGKGRPPVLTETGSLLNEMVGSGFFVLAEAANREIVLGTVLGGVESANHPKAAINFYVQDESDGWCTLSTETRVLVPDPSTLKKFAAYWRFIYPGSALLRRTMLSAVKRRAEQPTLQ